MATIQNRRTLRAADAFPDRTQTSLDNIQTFFFETEDNEDYLNEQIAGAAVGLVQYATWSELNAVTGSAAGQPGRVTAGDSGTHTDPVVGGTVDNAGDYRWSSSPAGWERIGDYSDASALEAEIDTARDGEANLNARLVRDAYDADALGARLTVQEDAATDARTIDMDNTLDERDRDGAYLWRYDEWGRMQVRRIDDPEEIARPGWSLVGLYGDQLLGLDKDGVLTETGQGVGGIGYIDGSDKPQAITEIGETVQLCAADAAFIERTGPDLYMVAYARPMIGAHQMRLHSARNGALAGSIFAGRVLAISEGHGQSNIPASGSSGDTPVQPAHRWASAVKMLSRVDKDPDVRLGVQAVSTTTQLFSSTYLTGFDSFQETIGISSYGGQTFFASYIDRLLTAQEADVGRPQVMLAAALGTGGATYAELGPSTETWTKISRARVAAKRLAKAAGVDIVRLPRKILHGESDILRFTQANIAAIGSGDAAYYDDLLEWRSEDDAAAITDLGLHASHEGLDLYITPARDLVNQPRVSAGMAMSWAEKNDPTHHCVAGPGYPLMAAYGDGSNPQHYQREGLEIAGELFALAEYERFWKLNDSWKTMQMVSATYVDSTHVDVEIYVPTLPLVVDTTVVAARPGNGFVILIDDTPASAVDIIGQAVQSTVGNVVTLRLEADGTIPTSFTNRHLAYGALSASGASAGTLDILPAGNIRDSTDIATRLGVTWHHWLNPHCLPF